MIKSLIFYSFLFWSTLVLGAIDKVNRSAHQYPSATEHKSVQVRGAQVVMADYALIARDFPDQARRGNEDEKQWKARVDFWLVSETAFIHENQTLQTTVNSEIPKTVIVKNTFRPKSYNRAHLIPVQGGIMDAKGSGAASPAQAHHRNGLATLGEMVREFLYEKLISAIFEHSGENMKTVGSYAVLDYGFDVIHKDGARDRAGYILRQAHFRSPNPISVLDAPDGFKVEKILRRYGITASGETFAFRNLDSSTYHFDYLNIQGTNNKSVIEVIDFGAFLAVENFKFEVKSADFETVMMPDSSDFVQPSESIRVPLEQWGAFTILDPKADKPWVWSHEFAKAWAEGRADRSAADRHFDNLVGAAIQKLSSKRVCKNIVSN